MTVYVALLRAVNLGPHNRLPMAELKRMCEDAGFASVRTFIASGNVVFESDRKAPAVKAALAQRLAAYAGKPVDLFIRTAGEMAEIAADYPFADVPGNRGVVIFLDGPPPEDLADRISGRDDERVAAGRREIYVAYGRNGIGRSKLKIPAGADGTARNINTVAKLAAMASS